MTSLHPGRSLIAALAPLLVGLAAPACSCASAHEIPDASGPTDAAPTPDVAERDGSEPSSDAPLAPPDAAGPESRYFSLELASADVFVQAERCEEREGATIMLRARIHYFSSCEGPGPVEVSIDPATHTVTVRPHLWREHGRTDCVAIGAEYTRDVAVNGLTAGTWMVRAGSTTLTLQLGLGAPPCTAPGTRPRGAPCASDCECAGSQVCLAVRGDAVCGRACFDPCETVSGASNDPAEPACPEAEACVIDDNFGWVCAPTTTAECDGARSCPAGMSCPPVTEGPPQCVWDIALDSSIRHDCTGNQDCDSGLDCVQRADGARRCEVRCTTSDMACPPATPHACDTASGVCEWLGE